MHCRPRIKTASRSQGVPLATLAFALIGLLGPAMTCQAGLVFEAPNITALSGTSGSFDIVLHNNNATGGASYLVAGDSLELSLIGAPGVHFTGTTIATARPYIFVISGTTQGGGPFSFDSFPNTSFLASDAEFAPLSYAKIGPGEIYGIAHVSYTIDSNAAAGGRTLAFGQGNSLSDPDGNPVVFATLPGVLTVNAVPEPATWLLVSLGLASSLAYGSRKARATIARPLASGPISGATS